MIDQQQQHVFISYVRENREQVDRLCQDLKRNGVNVWLDRASINPGARWKDAIREAINGGAFFLACFSEEYHSKVETHMNEELTLAIERLRKIQTNRKWFIPVLLSECDVPARSIGAGETLLEINWVSLYEDWDAGIQSILSVIKPIPPEIQKLIIALRSENRDVRLWAVLALGNIGPEAKAAVPALIEALKDKRSSVREKAAQALGDIGPEAKQVVPALIEALKDWVGWGRQCAAEALGNIGPEAKAAVPALIEALKDRYFENARRASAQALEKINTPEALKALEEYKQKSS